MTAVIVVFWVVWAIGGFIRFVATMDRPDRVLDYHQMQTKYLLIFGLIHGPVVFLLSIGFVTKRWWVENNATELVANVIHRADRQPIQTLSSQLVQQQTENRVLTERVRRLESLLTAMRKEVDQGEYQSEELRQLMSVRTGAATPIEAPPEVTPTSGRNIRLD